MSAQTNGAKPNGVNGASHLPEFVHTPMEDIPKIHEALQKSFRTGIMYPLAKRKQQLAGMARMLTENAQRWQDALHADLGKPYFQSMLMEVGIANQALDAIANLDDWAAPDMPTVAEHQKAWAPTIYKCPKGVVMIIAPWNYPLTLTVQPLSCALAAGNCVLLKPSELAPSVSALFAELVPKYFDPNVVRIVNGGVEETTRLLSLKWDHIFYTGNGIVGRIVAAAAAKHLTPVTLELGGKSPVVYDPSFPPALAARRILWGKLANAGQTCVAPDYVLCPAAAQPALVAAFNEVLREFYPEEQGGALKSPSYGRIVNERHFKRVQGLVKRSKGELVAGGKGTDEKRFAMEPIVLKTDKDDQLMEEEIFGPVLPLIDVKDMDDAIEFINDRDHPLALYIFTDDQAVREKFLARTRSGSIVFNDTFQQLGVTELPFGGIGASGYGRSTGKWGFLDFTHLRSSVDIPKDLEPMLGFRYPPYTKDNVDLATHIATGRDVPVIDA